MCSNNVILFKTNQVNEAVRKKENSERLEWIQNHVQCDGSAEVLCLVKTFWTCLQLLAILLFKTLSGKFIVLPHFARHFKVSFQPCAELDLQLSHQLFGPQEAAAQWQGEEISSPSVMSSVLSRVIAYIYRLLCQQRPSWPALNWLLNSV